MLIDLSELLSVSGKKVDIQATIEMNQFHSKVADYPIVEKSPFDMHLANTGKKMIAISFETEVELLLPCDRCLEDVRHTLNIKMNKEIDMNESDEKRIESMDELCFIKDSELDVERLIYNEILVHLPMKVLCNENCKGICNRCGANLNSQTCDCDTTELDPRMSKIRDIFNNFKEV